MKFGQSYPKATRKDLTKVIPSRNTVKKTVTEIATSNRAKISLLIKEAIRTGGVSATTDTWREDYTKRCYLAIVAHLTIEPSDTNIIATFYAKSLILKRLVPIEIFFKLTMLTITKNLFVKF